jgi:hypothetical protein
MSALVMTVVGEPLAGDALKEEVEAEIARFDTFFQNDLHNAPLVNVERAILSTYLWWKYNEALNGNKESSST